MGISTPRELCCQREFALKAGTATPADCTLRENERIIGIGPSVDPMLDDLFGKTHDKTHGKTYGKTHGKTPV